MENNVPIAQNNNIKMCLMYNYYTLIILHDQKIIMISLISKINANQKKITKTNT